MDRTDINRIWIDDEAIWIETKQGERACEYLVDYPSLRNADKESLDNYSLSFYGMHWEELDEDLSFDGFFEKCVFEENISRGVDNLSLKS